VEQSLYRAWLDLISNAEHFLYIEQQTFVSCFAGGGAMNVVIEVLRKRVVRAIQQQQAFRVILLLPVPEGVGAVARESMKWQYSTLCRGASSLLSQLFKEYPQVDLSEYICISSLRTHGFLEGQAVTEQIFINSSLVVADDRVAIISSSQVNDRSFAGDRDSEMGAVISDATMSQSQMGGAPFMAARTVRDLRAALWCEHLGLPFNDSAVEDAVTAYKSHWVPTADRNTRIYDAVFARSNMDAMHSVESFRFIAPGPVGPERLHDIRGHVVRFPTHFLKDDILGAHWYERESLIDPRFFQ